MRSSGAIKNRSGHVRWGWVVVLAYASVMMISLGLSDMMIDALKSILLATGTIPADYSLDSNIIVYINDIILPLVGQFLIEVVWIVIALAFWLGFLRMPGRGGGLDFLSKNYHDHGHCLALG